MKLTEEGQQDENAVITQGFSAASSSFLQFWYYINHNLETERKSL